MLVLSRKQGESFEFAGMDVVIRVVSLKKSKVQLGIEAPKEVAVRRTEQSDFRHGPPERDGALSGQHSGTQAPLLEELTRVEAELAALAEMTLPCDRGLARDLASESIDRLERVKREIRLSSAQSGSARPIAEFLRSRAEALGNSDVKACDSSSAWGGEPRPTHVRQASAPYTVALSCAEATEGCTAA